MFNKNTGTNKIRKKMDRVHHNLNYSIEKQPRPSDSLLIETNHNVTSHTIDMSHEYTKRIYFGDKATNPYTKRKCEACSESETWFWEAVHLSSSTTKEIQNRASSTLEEQRRNENLGESVRRAKHKHLSFESIVMHRHASRVLEDENI